MGGFSFRDPQDIVAILLAFIIATTIHEFMHAYTAWRLGDDTAASLGRITLDPTKHFEPFGFTGMVLISIGFGFIGWGKPVPVNPNRFTSNALRRRQVGMAVVAIAGPISNIVQAAIAVIPLRFASQAGIDLGGIGQFLTWFIWVNILLASFNMIPVPPLDGHKVLTGLLPNFWYPILAPMERYGFLILLALIFVGGGAGRSILYEMINPVRSLLTRTLASGNLFF